MSYIGNYPAATDVVDLKWQSVVTASTLTTVAGRGYPINTTSNACTVTLPAAASVGDQVQIVDYAGTFATNNINCFSRCIIFYCMSISFSLIF